jgi:hypothetical protein
VQRLSGPRLLTSPDLFFLAILLRFFPTNPIMFSSTLSTLCLLAASSLLQRMWFAQLTVSGWLTFPWRRS